MLTLHDGWDFRRAFRLSQYAMFNIIKEEKGSMTTKRT